MRLLLPLHCLNLSTLFRRARPRQRKFSVLRSGPSQPYLRVRSHKLAGSSSYNIFCAYSTMLLSCGPFLGGLRPPARELSKGWQLTSRRHFALPRNTENYQSNERSSAPVRLSDLRKRRHSAPGEVPKQSAQHTQRSVSSGYKQPIIVACKWHPA